LAAPARAGADPAPLLIDRPAMAEDLALSLSGRAQRAQAGAAAPGPQQDRSVRALLRAIQTMFQR